MKKITEDTTRNNGHCDDFEEEPCSEVTAERIVDEDHNIPHDPERCNEQGQVGQPHSGTGLAFRRICDDRTGNLEEHQYEKRKSYGDDGDVPPDIAQHCRVRLCGAAQVAWKRMVDQVEDEGTEIV